MPDPIDQTTPAAPAMPNPQDLVDAALEPPATAPMMPAPIETPIMPPPPAPTTTPTTDETPLAFMTPPPSMGGSTATAAPVMDAVVPPVPPAPPAPELKKKKSKVGLVIGGVIVLLIALVGGVAGYMYFGTTPQIARVLVNTRGNTPGGNTPGGNTPSGGNSNTGNIPAGGGENRNNDGGGAQQAVPAPVANPDVGRFGYVYPNGDIAGTYVQNGVRYLVQAPGTFDAAATYINSHPGSAASLNLAPSVVASIPTPEQLAAQKPGQTWAPPGVGGVPGWHWTTCLHPGTGVNGVGCDVKPVTTTITTTTTPSPSPSPVMACTGITRSPTTDAVVGGVYTFTCAGTVTPSSAGTLSYKYRYSIDGGTTFTNMTSNTLTIIACGTYSVQCQACATLSGVLTCSPTWTGATQ